MNKDNINKGIVLVTITALISLGLLSKPIDISQAKVEMKEYTDNKFEAIVIMKEDLAAIRTDIEWIKNKICHKE